VSFDKLLDRFFDSGLTNEDKSYHLTAVLQLAGFRYQTDH
jgi:hypothetical protein